MITSKSRLLLKMCQSELSRSAGVESVEFMLVLVRVVTLEPGGLAHVYMQRFLSMLNSQSQIEPECSTRTDLHTEEGGALELYHSQPPGGIQAEKMPNSLTPANNAATL